MILNALFLSALCTLVLLQSNLAAAEVAPEKPRNPYGLPDVLNPDSDDAQALSARLNIVGGPEDPNAKQWVEKVTPGVPGSIDGEWQDHWNSGGQAWSTSANPTQIKSVGDRVYIYAHASNGRYLLDLKRTGNRLVGRYQGIDARNDSGNCVLLVVGDDRIDGYWSNETFRWDFRRRLQ